MKIPEKITVGAITYTVKEVGRINDSADLGGRINYQLQEIELDTNVAPAAKEQIFMHEVIHAIHHHTAQNRDTCAPSERDVDSMASALLMIVKDNPGLFDPDDQTVATIYDGDGNKVYEEIERR